jgi:replicative superfamily II helicase
MTEIKWEEGQEEFAELWMANRVYLHKGYKVHKLIKEAKERDKERELRLNDRLKMYMPYILGKEFRERYKNLNSRQIIRKIIKDLRRVEFIDEDNKIAYRLTKAGREQLELKLIPSKIKMED